MTHHAEVLAAANSGSGGSSNYSFLLILALAVGAFWLMSRRTRKQQKSQQEFRSSLAPGDEVMTGSGLFGTVVAVDDEAITLESEPGGGRTRWIRAAIAKKIEPPVPADADEWRDDADGDDAIEVPDDLSSLPSLRKDGTQDGKPATDGDEPETK
ncbi:MAG: preprotein translocase subunit YajC [Brevundimonas sp.]